MISGVVSNWTGDYFIGRTNSGDLLRIEGSGKLAVTNGNGYIGYDDLAVGNQMLVTGSGSVWTNPGSLCIGYEGAASQLAIRNRGVVYSGAGLLGYAETSSNNTVLVTDPGTVWFAGSTSIGGGGSVNQLTIANGAEVVSDVSYVGLYSWSGSNTVLVTGNGSVWSNSSYVYVGSGGVGNQLTISNGAAVCDTLGGVSADSRALVTGSNSVWSHSTDLRVGGLGAQLDITHAGRVSNANGYLGYYHAGNGSGVQVADSGSVWNNDLDLWVGYEGGSYQLTIADGGMVQNNDGHVGYYDVSCSNVVVVAGAGSVWSNRGTLYMGQFGPENQLTISNGGKVYNDYGELGYGSSSSSNTVLVTGPGSVWSNRSSLSLGTFGGVNQRLLIQDGGSVYDNYCILGYDTASSNNTVVVSGAGSTWNHASQLAIGLSGTANQLVITNGGAVFDTSGGINTRDNTIWVTGAGSVWSNRTFLICGGSGNRLVVNSGGTVFSNEGRLGGNDNGAWVTGPGAVWTNRTNLYVGYLGAGNQLALAAGGAAYADSGVLGFEDGDDSNTVVVTGPGSILRCRNTLQVGVDGNGNSLVISNSGSVVVMSSGLVVGVGRSSVSNRATVAGGTVTATNASGNCALDVCRGLFTLNSGTVNADRLLVTNGPSSLFTFGGGTLKTRGTTVDNGRVFDVGNGVDPATYAVLGGTHSFADSLRIRTNATLSGRGTLIGSVLVEGRAVTDGSVPASTSTLAFEAPIMAVAPSALIFSGSVTNTGTLAAVNGGVLEFSGPVVNNGILDIIGGTTNFHSTFVNHGIVLDAKGDADGDGLPNGWERANGLDVLSAVGANGVSGDQDGDGMNNLQEYLAGTAPTNASSVLAITSIRFTTYGMRVDWAGGTDAWQYVECAGDVHATGAQWRTIFTNAPPTALTTNLIDAAATNRALYYRIKAGR